MLISNRIKRKKKMKEGIKKNKTKLKVKRMKKIERNKTIFKKGKGEKNIKDN